MFPSFINWSVRTRSEHCTFCAPSVHLLICLFARVRSRDFGDRVADVGCAVCRNLGNQDIQALNANDFNALENLEELYVPLLCWSLTRHETSKPIIVCGDLSWNNISAVEAGVFDKLTNLKKLCVAVAVDPWCG